MKRKEIFRNIIQREYLGYKIQMYNAASIKKFLLLTLIITKFLV